MSVAEPLPPAAKKLQPLQKWYMLFPENWVELAFDQEWRTKRLRSLRQDRSIRSHGFWICLALTWFVILLTSVGGLFSSSARQSSGPTAILLVVSLCTALVQAVMYMKFEVEQILLQLIDRFEAEDDSHGR